MRQHRPGTFDPNNADPRRGFTLTEVIVALVLLSIGLLLQAGSLTAVIRHIDHGRDRSRAAQVAANRLERLRLWAAATVPACGDPRLTSGGPRQTGAVTETWVVGAGHGLAFAWVTAEYAMGRRRAADTLSTLFRC